MGQCISAMGLKDEIVSGRYGDSSKQLDSLVEKIKLRLDPAERSRALKWSVQGNSNALVKLVLDMGVDVNHRDKRQRTALHHAVAGREPESIASAMNRLEVELEACNDPSSVRSIVAQYNAKSTITRYDIQIILTLLQAGADVDLVDACGLSALTYAALTGNLIGVTEILSHKPRIDLQDKSGHTTLIMAACLGHTEIAKALVTAGANLDVQNDNNDTALIFAACWGHTEIAKALVSAGANLDVQDKDGNTALILAASNGHTEVTRALVSCGAQLNIRDKDGDTALICAVACSQPHTADVIVSSARPGTLDIDAVNSEGWTAVTRARNLGYHPLAEKMILYGARREMDRQPEEMGHAQSSNLNNWQETTQAIKVGMNIGDILGQL